MSLLYSKLHWLPISLKLKVSILIMSYAILLPTAYLTSSPAIFPLSYFALAILALLLSFKSIKHLSAQNAVLSPIWLYNSLPYLLQSFPQCLFSVRSSYFKYNPIHHYLHYFPPEYFPPSKMSYILFQLLSVSPIIM